MFLTITPIGKKRFLEMTYCFAVFLMTPAYFLFQVCIIRPFLIEQFRWGSIKHYFHVLLASYLFINVAGNMVLCVLADSRVKAYRGGGIYCEHCQQKRPKDSFHCTTCNACILRRDHHCIFLAQCIGRNNQRYFTCYFCHLALAIIYATYYNYIILKYVFDLESFAMTTARLFNLGNWSIFSPSIWVFRKRMFVFFWFLNLVILPFAINLSLFHMYKAFSGLTWYDYKKGKVPLRTHWRRNMAHVFGKRWYLAIFWPFASSPLPVKRMSIKRELRTELKI
jgi:palmitoyltransferase